MGVLTNLSGRNWGGSFLNVHLQEGVGSPIPPREVGSPTPLQERRMGVLTKLSGRNWGGSFLNTPPTPRKCGAEATPHGERYPTPLGDRIGRFSPPLTLGV